MATNEFCFLVYFISQGVFHSFQYRGVHANICGPKFYVKSIFGSVNNNMDNNLIFWVYKSEKKEESWNLVRVSEVLDSIFGVLKTLGLIFRGQQRNDGMDPPVLKVR